MTKKQREELEKKPQFQFFLLAFGFHRGEYEKLTDKEKKIVLEEFEKDLKRKRFVL